ncbi:hypothetical protein MRX96_042553 [Rhipicephalus microplus]
MNRVNDPYVNIGGAGCRWGDGGSRRLPAPPPPVSKTPGRSVATWARQEGQEVPRYFISDAPWKTQQRVRRDLPLDRVPWPFRGCTLAEGEKTAGGAQLPTDAAVGFCATCRVAVHFKSHYKGAMHVARTKAAAEGEGHREKGAGSSPAEPALGHGPGGPVPTANGGGPPFHGTTVRAATDGPRMDGVATMDVDRLLEL